MAVTLPSRRPVAGSLRELAARMEELQGYRAEIIEGAITLSPSPVGAHQGIVRRLARQLDEQVSDELVAQQGISVESDGPDEDYAIPDLVVLPIETEYQTQWLFPAEIVDLAVEVVSAGNPGTDVRLKPSLYGRWGIPIYLLIDPRDGSLVVYSDPLDGRYRGCHRMRFGDVVTLPEPLKDIRIETADLPRYDG